MLEEKEAQIAALQKQIEQMSKMYTAEKEEHKKTQEFSAQDLNEFCTRKQYIDLDYVLFGKDGLPLAVIEAKKASKDLNIGRK